MSSRVLTAYLTLATLLFGNVAGWVHVGCSGHSANCCPPALTEESVKVHDQDDHAGDHCCLHDHGSSCQADASKQVEDSAGEPESEPPANQHDSDSCAVCQSFFDSRHATLVLDNVGCVESLNVTGDTVVVDDVFAPNRLSRSHTARGPPKV